MKRTITGILVFLLILAALPFHSFAEDVETTITPKQEIIYVKAGKSANIGLTIAPRAARSKGVTYESDNEAIATVSTRGKVTGVAVGECNIIVTSQYDPSVSVKVPVFVIVAAKKITLTADKESTTVGGTLALTPAFEPADTSVQQVTYKSGNTRIATVDENGIVTGVKAGKTNITATAVDGSKVHGRIAVQITQQVTGVSFKTPHVRVGVNYHGTFTAALEPKNATNKRMTWESEDESIATVSGSKNSVRIQGKQWGQTVVTGTTEDGGYQVRIIADIGSLSHAVRVHALSVKNEKPRITLENKSNMNITQVRYEIRGYDQEGNKIKLAHNGNEIVGTYDLTLAPGERTEHGQFNFENQTNYSGLAYFKLAITGWTCEDGYYDRNGNLKHDFNIAEESWEWIPNVEKIPEPKKEGSD